MSRYLGKLFNDSIKKTLDQELVNRYRRWLEDIKLQIMDAAENGKPPPEFYDANELYEIDYGNNDKYKFIFREFDDWLRDNGLNHSWKHEYVRFTGDDVRRKILQISPNRYSDFDDVEEPDTTSWLERLKKDFKERTF